jgi:uncharacterized protein (DUF1499 family)
MRILLGIIIVLAILFVVARILVARQPAPTNLGVTNGQLQPCPATPNCVSSQAPQTDTEHSMSAIPYTGDATFMMTQLLKVVSAMPRATIIKQEDNYLHIEFRSQMFRFVDDVEFYLDDTNKLIHFRSAARLGQGDMGVNRKRMTKLAEKLKTAL